MLSGEREAVRGRWRIGDDMDVMDVMSSSDRVKSADPRWENNMEYIYIYEL